MHDINFLVQYELIIFNSLFFMVKYFDNLKSVTWHKPESLFNVLLIINLSSNGDDDEDKCSILHLLYLLSWILAMIIFNF